MTTTTEPSSAEPIELWRYDAPDKTQAAAFMAAVNAQHGLQLKSYEDLYAWSIAEIGPFWEAVWAFTRVVAPVAGPALGADKPAGPVPRRAFFPEARLSYAQNLLFPEPAPDPTATAVHSVTEGARETVTWADLRERVRRAANAMRAAGVKTGDTVAGYVSNNVNTLVYVLAASALGAIWSSTSSEIGAVSVVERLAQIDPVLLVADNATMYNGKTFDNTPKLAEIVRALPSLAAVFVSPTFPVAVDLEALRPAKGVAQLFDARTADAGGPELAFELLPFDHPLFIVYSSGTTGKPKCIVHGQGGTLLQHKKEHCIHLDFRPGDVFFQYTTCSWMMWQWQISGLASGATVVLYDGSPFMPEGDLSMFRLIDELDVKYFGTSAKYLTLLEQHNAMPRETYACRALAAITSTGSVLPPSTFDYVYRAFGPVLLGSITGGTDILSLFGAPSFLLPVHRGEIQCRGLGMAVEVWDAHGRAVVDAPGDLVCTKPFPCMPVMFWNDADGAKYRASYFETFPGVWHHGDFVQLDSRTGGLLMLGRSDGVLKPSGVRFGSSEIYNVVTKDFAAEIDDSLCVGRRRPDDTDETVVLFVKPAPGVAFSDALVDRLRRAIRTQLSARHVPGIIAETPAIPYTANGKKVETIVKGIVSRTPFRVGASVANAECLDWYQAWADAN
ncbi:uncharacterized protein V1510DRAFT_414173 [Dipodascopsis tothii]|uniref:uncharacterized protein n=1 Tax=Dipodascopsis tothii TaxID=44089 RepID=UPI0034CE9231